MNFDLTGKRVWSARVALALSARLRKVWAQGANVVTCDINPDFVDDGKPHCQCHGTGG